MDELPHTVTFVLRVDVQGGTLSGILERVRTGEKHRFQGSDALAALLAKLVAAATAPTAAEP